jgi:hypothetical protein
MLLFNSKFEIATKNEFQDKNLRDPTCDVKCILLKFNMAEARSVLITFSLNISRNVQDIKNL